MEAHSVEDLHIQYCLVKGVSQASSLFFTRFCRTNNSIVVTQHFLLICSFISPIKYLYTTKCQVNLSGNVKNISFWIIFFRLVRQLDSLFCDFYQIVVNKTRFLVLWLRLHQGWSLLKENLCPRNLLHKPITLKCQATVKIVWRPPMTFSNHCK